MSTYTVGQTANLNLGPITNVVDGVAYDPTPVRLIVTNPAGTATTYTYGDDSQIVRDGVGLYHALVSLTSAGMWRAVWAWGGSGETGETNVQMWAQDPVAFATVGMVSARVGRDLTAAEAAQVPTLLQMATDLIAEACDKPDTWPATVTTIPPALRTVCVECVVRVLHNPTGARSQQEQIGSYLHSETYSADTPAGMALTASEERRVRRAVHGVGSGTVRLSSILDDVIELHENNEVT